MLRILALLGGLLIAQAVAAQSGNRTFTIRNDSGYDTQFSLPFSSTFVFEKRSPGKVEFKYETDDLNATLEFEVTTNEGDLAARAAFWKDYIDNRVITTVEDDHFLISGTTVVRQFAFGENTGECDECIITARIIVWLGDEDKASTLFDEVVEGMKGRSILYVARSATASTLAMSPQSTTSAEEERVAEERQKQLNDSGETGFLTWTEEGSYTLRELLYDQCSKLWNDNAYHRAFNPKFLVGGARPSGDSHAGTCFSLVKALAVASLTQESWNESRAKALADCRKDYPDCYIFATGNRLSEWAADEKRRLADGSRFADRRVAQNNSDVGSGGSTPSDDGDTLLGDLLGMGTAVLNGLNAGSAIGNALGGGGYSGGGSVSSGGSNADACQRLYTMEQQCRARNQSLGGGSVSGTQAGSFNDCAANYRNARIPLRCGY